MLIIPVIDLRKGIVVHAVKGNRENYRAIDSNLCASANPLEVINGFLKSFNYKSIYIADLDALEEQGDHVKIVESICNKYPDLEIWLDTGTELIAHYLLNTNIKNIRIILSSESLMSFNTFSTLIKKYPQHNFILSLDYKSDKFLGPKELVQHKSKWPKDVIILNLSSVGAEQGYQIPIELSEHGLTSKFNTYYGGGVRDLNDVNNLKSLGHAGVLISTALHTQKITASDALALNQ